MNSWMLGDCYFSDENGLFLCRFCSANEGSVLAHVSPRSEFDFDFTEATVLPDKDDKKSGLKGAE